MPSAVTFQFDLPQLFKAVVVVFIIAALIIALFAVAFPNQKAVTRAPSPYHQYSDIMDLCVNEKRLPESELFRQLERMMNMNPESLQSQDEDGYTPLHYAAFYRSPEFCKQLIQAGLSVKTTNYFDELPFLLTCRTGNVETAEYLFGLYPESINKHNGEGHYPIHHFALNLDDMEDFPLDDIHGMARLLLTNDQGAISVALPDSGNLPLHLVCCSSGDRTITLTIVKILFDAYPRAIFVRNNAGKTPIEVAKSCDHTEMVSFLEGQLELVKKIPIHEALQNPDVKLGAIMLIDLARARDLSQVVSFLEYQVESVQQFPIHQALLNSDVPLGTIKLIIETYPDSLRLVDSQGRLPLHIACQFRGLDVVKCLVDAEAETGFKSLEVLDESQSLPLHHACSRGKVDIVNYILNKTEYGVDMPSADKRLPIHLLLANDNCDTNNLEYIDTFGRLLRANPVPLITSAIL